MLLPSSLDISLGWGLIDLPLRASKDPDARWAIKAGLGDGLSRLSRLSGWFGYFVH